MPTKWCQIKLDTIDKSIITADKLNCGEWAIVIEDGIGELVGHLCYKAYGSDRNSLEFPFDGTWCSTSAKQYKVRKLPVGSIINYELRNAE